MRTLLPAFVFVLASGCGPEKVMPRDLRVAIPAADPAFLDFQTTEWTVAPGQDALYCNEIHYKGEDTVFNAVDGIQGKFGHHVIVLASTNPRGDGATFDCTEMTANAVPLAVSTGGEAWPTGYGSILKKGTPILVQMHYVNTGSAPILVRDVIRLKKMQAADVTTWVAPMVLSNVTDLKVMPKSPQKVTFDATVPYDVKLLFVAGHMHEWGTAMKSEIGADVNSLTTLYEVKEWKADYRDSPPANTYFKDPKSVKAGTIIRTTCEWMNTTDEILKFPHEMCVTFAYVGGTKEAVVVTK